MQAKATGRHVINQPFASRSRLPGVRQRRRGGGRKIGEAAGVHSGKHPGHSQAWRLRPVHRFSKRDLGSVKARLDDPKSRLRRRSDAVCDGERGNSVDEGARIVPALALKSSRLADNSRQRCDGGANRVAKGT